MTTGLMRRFSSSARTQLPRSSSTSLSAPRLLGLKQCQRHLTDARPRQASAAAGRSWFTSSTARAHELDEREQKRLLERNLKLGNTIRVLHDALPNLLNSPLPSDILSPHISLHLFPSTHPHLPTVRGRLAYTAALWTAPVAWGRVPVLGNVKLKMLSERMVKSGSASQAALRNEKLIVKWQTCGKTDRTQSEGGGSRHVSETFESVRNIVRRGREEDEFTGLFVFEFDDEGRIASHTIEHTEEGHTWDRTAKFISVTDWLLGRAWGRREETPSLAFARAKARR
ncbi:uncharacterized protein M421DRAFT_422522 [Didymella exigua CBS 183.55]|uniref:Uncharacterized protein n=1 Tax=Didymella exigua CBS 183.55 TaxID=1150837 RepID=A0A6A5RHH9_9PLEO|nr:uncharacterized protein M421DRAFT_422522 [Didymella exigua CBS 183.55]KAF1926544.1 hypothetical protein M421DRAFT_422522 [Didymella exigua CBS 183.55]